MVKVPICMVFYLHLLGWNIIGPLHWQEEAERENLTPQELAEEKLRQQKLQEDSDFELAKEMMTGGLLIIDKWNISSGSLSFSVNKNVWVQISYESPCAYHKTNSIYFYRLT